MMRAGLYVHIPFCRSKCFYCDFLSFPNQGQQEAYLKALEGEMQAVQKTLPAETTISSVFIGGGTPTVLPPFLLEKLFSAIIKYFNLEEGAEWTIEANPGTLTEEKVKVMAKYPLTRVSMGLQSTHLHLLKQIGRSHSFQDWEESMALLRKWTHVSINTDLMFALPGQTLKEWQQTLETVVRYQPMHLSLYALILEEGTVFWQLYEKGQLKPVEDELDRAMYHYAQQYLEEAGYQQYEISNWAKPGQQSQHNLLYWRLKPYIGLGLGAHGFIGNQRYYNEEKLNRYLETSGNLKELRHLEEVLTPKMQQEEYMFLGLRLLEGIEEKDFERRFKRSIWSVYGSILEKWIKYNVLVQNKGYIKLTRYGLDVCNEVFASFL